MSAIEVTDRKFLTKVKIINVNMDKCVVKIDNSKEFNGSDLIEIKVGEEDRFLLDYYIGCMSENILCNMEIGLDNGNGSELITGFIEVLIEKVESVDSESKYILKPVVIINNLPESIKININKDISDNRQKEHLEYIFNNAIENSETIEVGLGFNKDDREGKKGYYFKSIQYRYK